MWFSASVVLTW